MRAGGQGLVVMCPADMRFDSAQRRGDGPAGLAKPILNCMFYDFPPRFKSHTFLAKRKLYVNKSNELF